MCRCCWQPHATQFYCNWLVTDGTMDGMEKTRLARLGDADVDSVFDDPVEIVRIHKHREHKFVHLVYCIV